MGLINVAVGIGVDVSVGGGVEDEITSVLVSVADTSVSIGVVSDAHPTRIHNIKDMNKASL